MNKIVIVGGGSTWTPGLLNSLLKKREEFPVSEVVLYDVDGERQEVIGKYGELLFTHEYPECKFTYTTDKKEALANKDYVFCQMRTGGYKMREQDEKIPASLGLVGQETCGAGGFAYGMRSMKDMIELVKDVRELSRDAWILNYTNPAAIVSIATAKLFPEDKKILNICDQPVNLLRSYGALLGTEEKLEPKYFGLNHFGWFTNLYDQSGKDLMPMLKDHIIENGFRPIDFEQRDASWLATYANVEKILKAFPDYLPNTYLQYYLFPELCVKKIDPNHTRANEVMEGREARVFADCKKIVEENDLELAKVTHNDAHGDMIIEVAASIEYNLRETFIVIIPNNGIVSNLDDDVMIEVSASLGKNGPEPYSVGKIDTFYKGLIEQQWSYEKLTFEAFNENNYEKALMALTLNRTIVNADKAQEVLDLLIEANGDLFPKLK